MQFWEAEIENIEPQCTRKFRYIFMPCRCQQVPQKVVKKGAKKRRFTAICWFFFLSFLSASETPLLGGSHSRFPYFPFFATNASLSVCVWVLVDISEDPIFNIADYMADESISGFASSIFYYGVEIIFTIRWMHDLTFFFFRTLFF